MSHSSLTCATESDFVLLSTGTAQSCVRGTTREVREVATALSCLWQTSCPRWKWGLLCLLSWPSAAQTAQRAQTAQQDVLPLTSILALRPSAAVGSASGSNLHVIPWAGNCTLPCCLSNGLWVGSWDINHCSSG